jgi:AraC-like DNA-binding protein
MQNQSITSLVNVQNGNIAFKLFKLEESCFFNVLQRLNCFALVLVTSGKGKIRTGVSEYEVQENTLFTFAPFQPFIFSSVEPMQGIVIYFQEDFFYINQSEREMSFKNILYNNVFQPPFVMISEQETASFYLLCQHIKAEMQNSAYAQYELLAAYLKIFLINASRLKMEQQQLVPGIGKDHKEHYILQKLKDAIEENFKAKHTPAEYAALLFVTTKTLAKISKSHYNQTLSNMIKERIIIEAKRELYLTNKSVKEIAYDLGYEDEFYFSRIFKINTNVSPQKFRETLKYESVVA